MAKRIRQVSGISVVDPSTLNNLTYNNAAGAEKNTDVGRHLLALGDGASGFTTDATTARILPSAGRNLAVYNNSAAIHAITLGYANTVTARAAGVAGAVADDVGIACAPNDWTYIACSDQNWVIADTNLLKVYLIDDDTSIKQEASK